MTLVGLAVNAARLFHALHDACLAFASSMADDGCGHDHDDDPDGPDELTFRMTSRALHSLLEDAGIEAANGSSPSEAADEVLLAVEMRHIEAGVDDQ